VRIAFHTPLNAFDDGGISGDRRMARQIADGLAQLGHMVEPVRGARSYMSTPEALDGLKAKAATRIEELIAGWNETASAPDLWFTYHSYYKAPDLLGPAIAGRLGIPYVVAEASDSRRRATGEWASAVAHARASFAAADLHLCFTAQDRNSIAPWTRPGVPLFNLPPFIATLPPVQPKPPHQGPPRLITVAMMRSGVKHESYLALARTLQRLFDRPWTLTVIGDGPLRGEVELAFAALPNDRIVWRGALSHDAVAAELASHDIFIWPGLGEAYGLVYLEAQGAGLPVVAFKSGGVPETVKTGETALLVPEHDDAALAGALAQLLDDDASRIRMGKAAARFVADERSMDPACVLLEAAIDLALQSFQRRQASKP
jgi:glycosyltransferase involved in cell wall biosynthesis